MFFHRRAPWFAAVVVAVAAAAWARALEPEILWMRGGAAFSPNFVCLSADGARAAIGSADTLVKLWSLPDGRLLRTFTGHGNAVSHGCFSPDGTRLLTIDEDGLTRLHHAETGQLLLSFKAGTSNLNLVAFAPNGVSFATAGGGRTVQVWRAADGQLLRTFDGHTNAVTGLAFSADGRRLLSAGWDRVVNVWDVANGGRLTNFPVTATPFAGTWSRDGQAVVLGAAREVQFWSLGGQLLRSLGGYDQRVSSLAFSADGGRLAAGDTRGAVRFWNVASGEATIVSSPTNALGVFYHAASLSADGGTVAYLDGQRGLRVWAAATQTARTISLHADSLVGVAFSPDGQQLATTGGDTLRLLAAADGAELRSWAVPGAAFQGKAVAFSRDGQLVAGGLSDGKIRLWRTTDGGLAREFAAHPAQAEAIAALAVSPDGALLASGGRDRVVRLWRVTDGAPVRELTGHGDTVYALAFSPDGATLASAGSDLTARLWRVANGAPLRTLAGHGDWVLDAAFSADGATLVTAGGPTARLWRVADGQPSGVLSNALPVTCARFAPDGLTLAHVAGRFVGGLQYEAGFLRLADGRLRTTLTRETVFARGLEFSPDGARLALYRLDGSLVMLRNPFVPGARLSVARDAAGLRLELEGPAGARWRVEQSATPGDWSALRSVTAVAGITNLPLEVPAGDARLFRAVRE